MTTIEIKAVIKCIEECGQKATVSLVFDIASLIDPSVTMEQCRDAVAHPEVTVDDTLDEFQRQLRAKLEAEKKAFGRMSPKQQEAYIAAWEENEYCSNK